MSFEEKKNRIWKGCNYFEDFIYSLNVEKKCLWNSVQQM